VLSCTGRWVVLAHGTARHGSRAGFSLASVGTPVSRSVDEATRSSMSSALAAGFGLGFLVAAQVGPIWVFCARSVLRGTAAVGIAIGAIVAARYVSLRNSVGVLPIGAAMGFIVMAMIFVTSMPVAMVLMIAIGACAGFFVVPMNALLQHRGHVLMGAGHSIAVQNFNENIGILVMVGLYALMVGAGLTVNLAIVLFGLFVATTMVLVILRHRGNQARGDLLHLVSSEAHAVPSHPRSASGN